MRLFLHHVFGFRIIAVCVICTATLFHLQPSNGASRVGGRPRLWGTFFDFYGDRLERINPKRGDVLQKVNGDLILVYDQTYYFQMNTDVVEPNHCQVTCHFYIYPDKGDRYPRKYKKLEPVPNPEVTRALARRLAEKFLPFHPTFCNKNHYIRYILYGELNETQAYRECPLRAPLSGVTGEQILSGRFKLLDSFGKKHDFSGYDIPRQSVRPEPSSPGPGPSSESLKQGTMSEAAKTKRYISWVRRLSTFTRLRTMDGRRSK